MELDIQRRLIRYHAKRLVRNSSTPDTNRDLLDTPDDFDRSLWEQAVTGG